MTEERRKKGMYEQEFHDKVIEIHTDMKYVRKWIDDHSLEDDKRFNAVSDRLKSLEDDRLKVVGGAGVLGVIGGILTKWFFK